MGGGAFVKEAFSHVSRNIPSPFLQRLVEESLPRPPNSLLPLRQSFLLLQLDFSLLEHL